MAVPTDFRVKRMVIMFFSGPHCFLGDVPLVQFGTPFWPLATSISFSRPENFTPSMFNCRRPNPQTVVSSTPGLQKIQGLVSSRGDIFGEVLPRGTTLLCKLSESSITLFAECECLEKESSGRCEARKGSAFRSAQLLFVEIYIYDTARKAQKE